jgi:hypothetical protein
MKFFKVDIIESEAGWGQKLVSTRYFDGGDDGREANEYARKFNASNTENHAPSWYMVARAPETIDIPQELLDLIANKLARTKKKKKTKAKR